ncbi:MAG: toll/interleukin-1 receptor domain-containing protein [Arenimonas sp.]
MPDIFVSYATADRDAAFRIVGFLEGQGIHCWVAPRDVAPGVEYGHAIINAIEQCKALVLVLSDQSNDSQFVRKEVERAVSKTKVVLPVRIREITPSGSLEFYISSAQWVDAWKTPMEQHLMPLVAAIKAMNSNDATPVRSAPLHAMPAATPARSHSPLLLGVAVVALLAAAITGTLLYTSKTDAPAPQVAAAPATTTTNSDTGNPSDEPNMVLEQDEYEPAPTTTAAPVTQTQAAPVTAAPAPATVAAPAAPVSKFPKRNDIAFVVGTWCQPYNGMTIRYDVIRTGADTVLIRVDHPQAQPWDIASRVKAVPGGWDFMAVDMTSGDSGTYRYEIIDDTMMKLTMSDGEVMDGSILRMRCAPQ